MFLVPFRFGMRFLSAWYMFREHVSYFWERIPYHRFILIWYVFRLNLVRTAIVYSLVLLVLKTLYCVPYSRITSRTFPEHSC